MIHKYTSTVYPIRRSGGSASSAVVHGPGYSHRPPHTAGPFRGRDVIGVSGTIHPVVAPTNALRHVAEECMDFAGGGTAVVMPPAVFAGVVAANVTTLADAGMVTIGVAGLANAGMAFPADLAGVVAADVTTLFDAGMVTV